MATRRKGEADGLFQERKKRRSKNRNPLAAPGGTAEKILFAILEKPSTSTACIARHAHIVRDAKTPPPRSTAFSRIFNNSKTPHNSKIQKKAKSSPQQ